METQTIYSGIDLAAKEENKTGLCRLGEEIKTFTLHADQQIIEAIEGVEIAAVDAPLTETDLSFRKAERELMKEYGPVLPLNMDGMKKLASRGLKLASTLSCPVIETYPSAVEEALDFEKKDITHDFGNEHEYDAYLCALTAEAYKRGNYRSFGKEDERIILPK